MLKVAIITAYEKGSASYILDKMPKSQSFDITHIIKAGPVKQTLLKKLKRKLKKIVQIGPLGAWTGYKMRDWYKLKNLKSIKLFAEEQGINYIEINSLSDKKLSKLLSNTDLAISLGNGYIPKTVYESPKYGMINIHHEVLPYYQNAQPIIWQIYNRSIKTGYTIHKITQGIDQGEILKVVDNIDIRFAQSLEETVRLTLPDVYNASAIGLADVLTKFLTIEPKKQTRGAHYTTPSWKSYKQMQKNCLQWCQSKKNAPG
jgi:methionyl-tRNA formyltransferase